MSSERALINDFDALIRRDPARRGLISTESQYGPLCAGHLAEAAEHLAHHGRHAAIVTGFFVPSAQIAAAETDGPPGAVLLALALEEVGIRTTLVTDNMCLSAVRAAAQAAGYTREPLEFPRGVRNSAEKFFDSDTCSAGGQSLTHLIAVERVGPNHTLESFKAQARTGPAPLEAFTSRVPLEFQDHCYNMRGVAIDEYVAETHRLFEEIGQRFPDAKTIGIGDGANEIGMGSVPWEEFARRLDGEQSARIPCRVATHWNIIAGTSNWGAFALAAAVLLLRERTEFLRPLDRRQQLRALEEMVRNGPAVDGVTGQQEPTVDGLPFLTYIQPWEGIRRLLGFGES